MGFSCKETHRDEAELLGSNHRLQRRVLSAIITTPAASQESNGMSEAFVNTIKRDYADLADRSSATAVLAQLPIWFDDYNHEAPHSALGMKTPAEYRREKSLS